MGIFSNNITISIPPDRRDSSELDLIEYINYQLKYVLRKGDISQYTVNYAKDNSKVILKPLKLNK